MAGETIGGEFWKQVKVGRPLLIDDPNELWSEYLMYAQYCKDNPIETEDWVGKDAVRVIRKKPMPQTLTGFILFVGGSENWWQELRKNKNLTPEYLGVLRAIEASIKTQQVSGAVAGVYKENIVARINGMADHKEVANTGEITVRKDMIDYSKLSDEALREIAAASNSDQPEGSEG